jgi:hypothetical protein
MPEPASFPYSPSYEQACDRLIAMCNGDARSTIKALILANEYLEIELSELRTKASHLGASARQTRARRDTA